MNLSCPLRYQRWGHIICLIIFVCVSIGLTACTEQPPVKIGFVGGLSGRVADLGLAARNGAILAIEEQNRAGGINGKDVQLIVMDDKQDSVVARKAVATLLKQNVDAIIGPLTSSMSKATIPLANEQQVVMISPTTTTEELTGLDDYFFRVVASTHHYANHHAFHLHNEMGINKMSVIYDLNNKSFAESYLRDFCSVFEERGGQIVQTVPYSSKAINSFYDLAKKAIESGSKGILIIASAVDTASLCQQIKKINSDIQIATSEWSATEKLIQLGGSAVEGILFHQFFNRESTDPIYLKFHKTYMERFSEEPGYSAVASYDSTKIILDGIKNKKGRTLKETLVATATFPSSQGSITLDRFGDTERKAYLSTVKNGQFVILEASHKH